MSETPKASAPSGTSTVDSATPAGADSITMAVTSGVLLMLGFLWVRHIYLGIDLGTNTLVTLWPVWFPPAFYVGAYSYLGFLVYKAKNNG